MYHIFKAVKNRLEDLLMAEAFLSEDSLTGTSRIKLTNTSNFNWQNFNKKYPEIIMQDNTPACTGRVISGGYEGMPSYNVQSINNSSNEIVVNSTFEKDWTVANQSKIRKAPSGILVKDIRIGDLQVVQVFPTICVVPTSKRIEWKTLSGTKDNIGIEFIIYVEGADTERSTEDMMKITDMVEYILMTNLHISPVGADKDYQVTSHAMINSIDYGVVQKGSQFLKASRISWEADMYLWRGYLTAQGELEAPLDGPH
jgi:hypothetical protein